MKTTVKKINVPPDRRMIVTSDIHGHYHHLKNVLTKVGFSKNDMLFIIGDMIDKGPLSLKTFRYIMKLCDEYTVYPLMGNVDASRLVLLDDDSAEHCEKLYEFIAYMEKHWGGCLFSDMCRELEISVASPQDIPYARQQINIRFNKELDFMRKLPTIIETQNYIFVHGGLPSGEVDSFVGEDVFQFLKNDAFMEKGFEFDKYVVVGHWPVTLYDDKISSSNPIINKRQKIISIDGGCGLKRDGQLNALVIPHIESENIYFEAHDEFPVAIARTPQEKSADSINIRYTDNKISILEKGGEFSFVEHNSSGYRLWIQNDYIYGFDEKAACYEYTDYRVPVNAGDRLSIVKETSRGYLVKKDGISGWYEGIIEYESVDMESHPSYR